MKNFKYLILASFCTTSLFANCTYNLDVNFDFPNKQIDVKANISSDKTIQLDNKDFNINDKKFTKESNEIYFSYTKEMPKLNEKYIYMLNQWYPNINQQCTFDITTNLDEEYKKIYENTNKPIDKFTFIASKEFKVSTKLYNNIKLQTFFLREDEQLVNRYFDKTIEYIKLYEEKIAKFPFNEFKVVENIYQTGYSMPTFTLIGSRLLNKDYILNQSLGHEILHQYFCNSIFIDYEKGNWAEGLTTFLADDYYRKLSNEDIENRKIVLNQYETFINEKNETAVNKFRYRFDKPSSMIGYNKLSFIFHMLENKIGEDELNFIIKKLYAEYKFKKLSMQELSSFIDENTKIDLKEFFNQWLNKKGIIDFEVIKPNTYYNMNGFNLEFTINQDSKNFFKFDLPIKIKTSEKTYTEVIPITKANQKIELNFANEVYEVTIDEKYDLFRKLSKNEQFLTIANLMEEKDIIAVVNQNDLQKYKNIKRVLPNIKLITSEKLKFKDLKDKSVLFLDWSNDLINYFYPNLGLDRDSSYLEVKSHIYDKNKIMAILNFGEYKSRYLMMLKHFSKYSKIVFNKDETIKVTNTTQNGIKILLNKPTTLSKIEKKKTIDEIYKDLDDKKIIYVGESHDRFDHHMNQLNVIKSLYKNNKNIAIAMEMFQKPFQKHLDEYIEGKTSLNEFLKASEYYKRWRYNFNLYKPIIDFAKENKIPLVAINIDREINKQVSKDSILSLNEEQRKIAPKEIDQSNFEYKNVLEKTFSVHIPIKNKSKMSLDKFYQSQLIWDEAMAENIDNYINENPDKTVVVLAGSGHIENHHGIVSRVFRRNQLPFQVIVTNPHKTEIGDIVLINKTKTNLPKEKKIGVALQSNDNLTVIRTVVHSFGKKIGIKAKDKIVKLNGEEVKTISDIKRVLYLLKDIDKLTVTVKRKDELIELKNDM